MLLRMIATMLLLMVAAAAPAAEPPSDRAEPEPQWSTYLVKVSHIALQDIAAEDAAELQQLKRELAQAKTASDKRAAKRALEHAAVKADSRRGAVIHGWSRHADAVGTPVSSTRSMHTFYVPNDQVNRATLGKLKPDSVIAIDRNGSRELLVFGGRKHVTATRCALVKSDEDFGASSAFKLPPDQPLDHALRSAIVPTLTLHRTETTEKGNTLYRYMLKITVDDLPPTLANRPRFDIWVNGRIRTADGMHIGPFYEHVTLERSAAGQFGQTRSYEFIALNGLKLDENSAAVELLAVQ